ncbi:RDD family protein [Clostridium puniceum]|uniref:RDD family protein n=1 Tax=Clostridium puniceum TaxID=29367 RepID=A0A1S8TWA7_9CLOT|nr:RDD family protein [Clostridium puniceum]OOM81980.1 RDD family protein [Clostridium puniceum]
MLKQNKEDIVYAGFFVRLSAYIIDCIIVGIALLIIRIPKFFIYMMNPDVFFLKPILFEFSIFDVVIYLCGLTYFVLMTYYCGGTLGKKLFKLKVCKATHEKLSLFTIIYRESIGRYLSGLILFIGYIMIGLDSKKRALHDMLSDTLVVYNIESIYVSNNDGIK